jgi:DNA modification methylase
MAAVVVQERMEMLPVAALVPYARNSRTHSEQQVAQIAASMREFGFTNPVLVDEAGGIIAGHGRVMAAKSLGLVEVPCIRLAHLSEAQKRAYVIADNKLALNAGWDEAMLRLELEDLQAADFDLDLLGFNADELGALLTEPEPETEGLTDPDEAPEPPARPVTVEGDVWLLGKHRVMCGDSTSVSDVEKLMDGAVAHLLHADPPYGMGKEADGVINDNLYANKLDAFQMEWWATYRTFVADNASAYIWGNAPDLWRLWWSGGLGTSEKLHLRNEIVWDKKSSAGMASPDLTQFPMATERCLFFQLGDQFLGNINADDFPETWEPVRAYFEGEAIAAGIKPGDIKRVCGCGMYSHWFTRSQYTLMPEKHYRTLAAEYPGLFARPWAELKAEWARVRGSGREVINGELDGVRAYFDNAHDVMRDVWEFPRVTDKDRHGHATPKPVAMMERVMNSSLPRGGLCVEPFGGSGSTLMAAETTGRVCFTMEMQPRYVDVIVNRWQAFTGRQATLEATGQTFAEVEAQRA